MTGSVSFDRAAGFYDATRGIPEEVAAQFGAMIAEAGGMDAGSRVLEIGVGTGRAALPVARHSGAIIFGIDISRAMMGQLVRKRNDERVLPVEGDAARLPIPDDAFNAAYGVHVFHLISNWRDVLTELVRVMKPGARFVLAGTEYGRKALWKTATDRIKSEYKPLPNVGVTREQLPTFLGDEGWQLLTEQRTSFTHSIAPRVLATIFEKRIISETWRMSDEQLAHLTALAYDILNDLYDDLDTPQPVEGQLTVSAWLPKSQG